MLAVMPEATTRRPESPGKIVELSPTSRWKSVMLEAATRMPPRKGTRTAFSTPGRQSGVSEVAPTTAHEGSRASCGVVDEPRVLTAAPEQAAAMKPDMAIAVDLDFFLSSVGRRECRSDTVGECLAVAEDLLRGVVAKCSGGEDEQGDLWRRVVATCSDGEHEQGTSGARLRRGGRAGDLRRAVSRGSRVFSEVTRWETGRWPSLAPRKRPPHAFFWSQAKRWSVAIWSLVLGLKQTTKQPKDGYLEPGWGIANQPNRPIVLRSSAVSTFPRK